MTVTYGSVECGLAALAPNAPEHLTLLEDSADALLARHGGIKRVRGYREQRVGFDPVVWRGMADAGWLGILVPQCSGGIGLGHLEMCVVAERLGATLAPEPFASVAALAIPVIAAADNATLREHLLPKALAGKLVPALAWQADGETDLVLDVATNCLHGRKTLVRPIGGADGFIVSVNTPDGLALYWIAHDAERLHIDTDLLTDGGFAGRLTFAGTPARECLFADSARAGWALNRAIESARLAASAELIGVMKQAFDITRAYLQDRIQFGKPIASFQTVQHRLADLFIAHRLACASVLEAVRAMDGDADDRTAAAAVSGAKARCGNAGLTIAREAVQLHGAIGYTDEYDIGLFLKRTLVLAAWLGNAKFHRRRFASLNPAS
ncbi:MAG: alkylation response protein AidB-like acyl-CoA dehydrogenase [Gammaproteobacteria bacterium]|jgi:alkylation response protein AidB-like acyl-CoA dehydrogenase